MVFESQGGIGQGICCLGGYNSELDMIRIGDGAVLNEEGFMAHIVEIDA